MRGRFLTFVFVLFILFANAQSKELDSLTLQLAFQKPDSSKVDTSIKLIDILYSNEDYKKAIMFIDESERLAQSLNYHKGTAEVNYYKAMIFADKDDYYNAIDNFIKSKKVFEEINDTLGLAKVNNGIGLIEINRGNYDKGLEASLKAIKVFEDKKLYNNLSTAYNNLATAYYNTEKYDKSLEYNFKAAQVRELLEDTVSLSSTYRNIATLYSLNKDPENAISYYQKVLDLLKINDNEELRGEILPKIGQEYLSQNELKKAAEFLVEGAKYNRKINNKEGLLQALNGLAKYNIIKKQYDLAEGQVTEAGLILKELNDDKQLLENYDLMMKLDSAKGNFRSAFMWQREYQILKDKLYKNEYKTAGLNETDYNTTDNEKEKQLIKQLQLKDAANTKQIKKLKLVNYILLGAFLMVSTLLLLIYLNRKNRIKYTRELENKNKQIQAQNNEILIQSKNLEELNVVKDKLFSIVSHDLKDSVTSIKAFIDLLKDGSITKDEFDELIPELSENADNASLLLMNLLNWSKSQMESLKPKPVYFDLQEIFSQKKKLVEQKLEKKKINLVDETKPETIYADKSMVEIIIQNLITNAVKFCNAEDTITISNTAVNGTVLLSVKDTGVGISEENQKKLFKNSFTTIGTTNEKGTGLGLTICKELVELNHGRIWLESSEGVGSKFYVELPRGPVSKD